MQVMASPLVATLVLGDGGNLGMLLDAVPQLFLKLEPLQRAVEKVLNL